MRHQNNVSENHKTYRITGGQEAWLKWAGPEILIELQDLHRVPNKVRFTFTFRVVVSEKKKQIEQKRGIP